MSESNQTRTGNPLRRLVMSSKGIVVLATTALAFGALYAGKASFEETSSLLRWIIGPWLAAVGIEDAAKHVGQGLRDRAS